MAKKPLFKRLFASKEEIDKIEPSLNSNGRFDSSFRETGDTAGLYLTNMLSGEGNVAKSRDLILRKWRKMERDSVISTALKMHVSAALGGHETQGGLVFIEDSPGITDAEKALIQELRDDLLEIFDSIAVQVAYNGIAFGDGFCRHYAQEGKGIVRVITDEMVHPSLVIPYEKAGETSGYLVGGAEEPVRLTTMQMSRFKMARVSWIPQFSMYEKATFVRMSDDDVDAMPNIPAMLGGSLLFNAEEAYDNFKTSLLAVTGQRWVDSIDEALVSVNLAGSSPEQQKRIRASLVNILTASKKIADQASEGKPFLQRVRHVLFTSNEKQIVTHGEGMGSKRAATMPIEDILMHAKLLAGSLGIDLSMLGFADLLSGGLGEGGYFRTSAQVAESSRMIRTGLSQFFNDMIDVHMLYKYGKKFKSGKRPYTINFYGSISAYEAEKQRTRMDAINSAGIMVGIFEGLERSSMGESELVLFMTKELLLDQEEAQIYAKAMVAKKEKEAEQMGGY